MYYIVCFGIYQGLCMLRNRLNKIGKRAKVKLS